MNVDSYSTSINCYTTFKKGNFEIFAIYLHWKLKVDMYCGTKISSKRDMYCGTEGVYFLSEVEEAALNEKEIRIKRTTTRK